jgi:hypothetical protein
MPVLLQPDKFEHWLSGNMGVEELKPAPNNYLQRLDVSKRVNSSKADSQFSPSTTVRAARGADSRPYLASVFQGNRKSSNIHADSGVIWGILV